MMAEIELYEALVDAGVSKDKARDVVLAQKEAMDQFLTTLVATLATKADLAEFRTYVDGRFSLVAEQMISMTNKIVVRLGALTVVLFGLLGSLLTLMHR